MTANLLGSRCGARTARVLVKLTTIAQTLADAVSRLLWVASYRITERQQQWGRR